MAYVAMSRVHTLEGLHLTAFDPKSIIVNNSCLEEVDRLHIRSCFRKDLPLYEIPVEKKRPVKYPLVDDCDKEAPAKKKPKRPTCKKRPADAPKTEIVKSWELIDPLHHDMNGLTTGITQ